MDRRKVNLAFIRLEHFLEQCVKLKGHNPSSLPTPEMAKNVRTELLFLLDNVPEITFDHIPSVTEVISNVRLRNVPGIHTYSDQALKEFLFVRSEFIRRADNNFENGFEEVNTGPRKPVFSETPRYTGRPQLTKSSDIRSRKEPDFIKSMKEPDFIKSRKEPEPMSTVHDSYHLNFTDLSNMNRPTKIAERFNLMYDNTWTDAFEELTKLYKFDIRGQERAVTELASILKQAFQFTEEMAEMQKSKMSSAMKSLMVNPSRDINIALDTGRQTPTVDPYAEVRFAKYVKQAMKENADLGIPSLIKNFGWEIRRHDIRDILDIHHVKTYCHRCVELTWLMNVQDPSMSLMWPSDVKRDDLSGMFRSFTHPGSMLKHEVWPALLLTKDGPLITKGVAHFR